MRIRSASAATATCLSSSALPLPMKKRASGRSRRPARLATGSAPADTASCLNSCRSSGSTGAPSPRRTSTARSPVLGRSNTQASRGRGHLFGRGLGSGCALFRQPHVARRHDGRDRVLVDHLADTVLQEHDELVKGVDLTLQLYAIDQIDRHRHPLLAQGIQEGVLQGLAFGHHVLLIFPLRVFGRTIEPHPHFHVRGLAQAYVPRKRTAPTRLILTCTLRQSPNSPSRAVMSRIHDRRSVYCGSSQFPGASARSHVS